MLSEAWTGVFILWTFHGHFLEGFITKSADDVMTTKSVPRQNGSLSTVGKTPGYRMDSEEASVDQMIVPSTRDYEKSSNTPALDSGTKTPSVPPVTPQDKNPQYNVSPALPPHHRLLPLFPIGGVTTVMILMMVLLWLTFRKSKKLRHHPSSQTVITNPSFRSQTEENIEGTPFPSSQTTEAPQQGIIQTSVERSKSYPNPVCVKESVRHSSSLKCDVSLVCNEDTY